MDRSLENISVASDDRAPWQRAYAAIMDLGIVSGLRVTGAWLHASMGVPEFPERHLGESDPSYAKRCRWHSLQVFEPQKRALADALLERDGMWLRSCGSGPTKRSEYEIRNADGAKILMRDTTREIKRSVGKASTTLAGMSTDGLTDAQRSEHADAQAKAAFLSGMVKRSAK